MVQSQYTNATVHSTDALTIINKLEIQNSLVYFATEFIKFSQLYVNCDVKPLSANSEKDQNAGPPPSAFSGKNPERSSIRLCYCAFDFRIDILY